MGKDETDKADESENKEDVAKKDAAAQVKYCWMWSDLNPLAKRNTFRWSAQLSFMDAVEDLTKYAEETRPVTLRKRTSIDTGNSEDKFQNPKEAIEWLHSQA